jgi:hypothetical protein
VSIPKKSTEEKVKPGKEDNPGKEDKLEKGSKLR